MHKSERILAVLLVVVFAGCEPRTAEKADAGGVMLTIEPDLRIDAIEHELVPISWLGVSPAGVIAVTQPQDHRVVFFDSTGKSLGAVGREGSGPGEFRSPVRGGWIGDTLWISDVQISRVTLIDAERNVSRMVTVPRNLKSFGDTGQATNFNGGVYPYAAYPGDTLLVHALRFTGTDATSFPLERATADGTLIQEVTRVPMRAECSVRVESGRRVLGVPVPFCARPQWAASPNGRRIAVLTNDVSNVDAPSFQLRVVDATGHEVVNRTYPFEPVSIPAAAIDSAIDARTARLQEVRAELEPKLRAAAPPIYPQAEHIVIGDDDRLWVGMRPTAEGQPWLVLNPDGEPAGRIVLPSNVTLRAAGATHITATERDELDLESIVRYRIADAGAN